MMTKHDVPHDEFVQDTFPDQEWRGTWVAQTNFDEDNHDKDVLVPKPFKEEPLSRNIQNSKSLQQPYPPTPQFSTTPHKASNTTTKMSSNIVVTPQTVSTSAHGNGGNRLPRGPISVIGRARGNDIIAVVVVQREIKCGNERVVLLAVVIVFLAAKPILGGKNDSK